MAVGDEFDVKRKRFGFGPVAHSQSKFIAGVGGSWLTVEVFSMSTASLTATLLSLLHTRVLKCR